MNENENTTRQKKVEVLTFNHLIEFGCIADCGFCGQGKVELISLQVSCPVELPTEMLICRDCLIAASTIRAGEEIFHSETTLNNHH